MRQRINGNIGCGAKVLTVTVLLSLSSLIAETGLTSNGGHTAKAPAGTETVLHTFSDVPDGKMPLSGLIRDSAGNMYGTTQYGGDNGVGSVFELSPDGNGGWSYRTIYSLTGDVDGAFPSAPLASDAQGNLYGTDTSDDIYGFGAVFELSPDGNGNWNLTNTYTFDGTFGGKPQSAVYVDAGGNVFGTTHTNYSGGDGEYGGIFELSPNGNGWTEQTLYIFPPDGLEGEYPDGGLIMDRAGSLYGTTNQGGPIIGSKGTVYRLRPAGNGWVLTILYNFPNTLSQGQNPLGSLIFDAYGNLYGTTQEGGPDQYYGSVFQLKPWPNSSQAASANGQWQINYLYFFTGGADGGGPYGAPTMDAAGNLYGTTAEGGVGYGDQGSGVVWKLTPSGQSWTESVLYTFSGASDGSIPVNPVLIDNAGHIYGTTQYGGMGGEGWGGDGVVFEVTE